MSIGLQRKQVIIRICTKMNMLIELATVALNTTVEKKSWMEDNPQSGGSLEQ